MPVNKEAYIRYRIIDECLRDKRMPYPSMDDLIATCEDKLGKTFSDSTIQKDIKAMKEDSLLGYQAPIKYSKKYKGYHYTDPNFTIAAIPLNDNDIQAIEFAASVLQQFKGIALFEQFDFAVDKIFSAINIRTMLDEEDIDEVIQIEKVPYFKGSEWLGKLLEAIKERQVIKFNYQRFDADEQRQHSVHPYLLKEYRNRWYLVGMLEGKDYLGTFGLDRMSDIEATDIDYRYNPDFNAKTYFKHAYGITAFTGEPSEVVLNFKPAIANYIKTQPLHETQEILLDNDDECRIKLVVGITIELIRDILMYGNDVQVIAPNSLQETIKAKLQEASKQY